MLPYECLAATKTNYFQIDKVGSVTFEYNGIIITNECLYRVTNHLACIVLRNMRSRLCERRPFKRWLWQASECARIFSFLKEENRVFWKRRLLQQHTVDFCW